MTEVDVLYSPAGARILRKVLVSLAIGALAYSITALSTQPEIWSITLSVFIGGVTLVVQFLIEFETRLARVEAAKQRHSDRVETVVEDGFQRVGDATRLFSYLEASAVPTESVVQLVRHAATIRGEPPLALRLAEKQIERLSRFLKDLGEQRAEYEGEDRDWLLALTELASLSIDATSLTTVDARGADPTRGGFWGTDLGKRYLEAQHVAVQRGVAIRRIVVLQSGATPADAGLSDVLRLQHAYGIQVRVLTQESAPLSVREQVKDFVLFDGVLSYDATPASGFENVSLPAKLTSSLELDEKVVQHRQLMFTNLWDEAEPIAPNHR